MPPGGPAPPSGGCTGCRATAADAAGLVHVVALAAAVVLADVAIVILRVLAQVDLGEDCARGLHTCLAQRLQAVAGSALDRLPPVDDKYDLVSEAGRHLGVGDAGDRSRVDDDVVVV